MVAAAAALGALVGVATGTVVGPEVAETIFAEGNSVVPVGCKVDTASGISVGIKV